MADAEQEYGLSAQHASQRVAAPELPYQPRDPESYSPSIGLIGCGGITEYHLAAYRDAGYDVTALCDIDREHAEGRAKEFYPDATVTNDFREILDDPMIDVVDIATHPKERVAIIQAALEAGKHVLSQKPFVENTVVGEELVTLANMRGLKLAVNQNGRWAPHWSYMRHAIDADYIGKVTTADFSVQWDHNWVADTPFNDVHHLVLYDFAIHWFDIATVFFAPRTPLRVYAELAKSSTQRATPPLIAHITVDWDGGQATLSFNGDCPYGQRDTTTLVGAKGTLRSEGSTLSEQVVTLHTAEGEAVPELKGTWFKQGFHGAMAELLCAIDEDREPINSAKNNLATLDLCFAAVASVDAHEPIRVGDVKRMAE
jgi:predicted dehydrogenase